MNLGRTQDKLVTDVKIMNCYSWAEDTDKLVGIL